ncbi:hypothetical protein BDN72DRAFT_840271 [Pluteus cervinus]|uniref:Uncharacterized protein n=1 Tax=Pluteus cervinus TaxID=181527 RepID=A0ACD3AVF7_9AGAR|nr:hypothetical protein BDN72DRAFT_840271 [Pluteus cervinus]
MAKSKSSSASSNASPVPHTLFYVSPFLSASYLQAVTAPDLLPLITELSNLKTREFYDEACKTSITAQTKLIQAFLGSSKSSVDEEQNAFINQMSQLATKKAREFEGLVREEVKKRQQADASVAWSTPPWVSPLMPFAPPMWPPAPFGYGPHSPPPSRAPWSYSWQQSFPPPALPESNSASKKKVQKETGAKNADSGSKSSKEKGNNNPNGGGGKKKGATVRFEDECTDSDSTDGKGNCLDWMKRKKKGTAAECSSSSSNSDSDSEDSDTSKKSKKKANTAGKGNQQGKNGPESGRKQQQKGSGGGSQPPAKQGGQKGGGDKPTPPHSQLGPYSPYSTHSYPPGSFSFHQGYARWDYRTNGMEVPSSGRYQVWIPPAQSDDKDKEKSAKKDKEKEKEKKQKEKEKEEKKKQKEKARKKEESDSDEGEVAPAWMSWRRDQGY